MTPLRIRYDAETNAAYMRLSEAQVAESAEVSPDIVLDYDAEGHIVGIELLDARKQLPAELLAQAA
ncbi:DUF2283 domain-containing protein [Mangrovicella endophytica]|uniref:DUF2283 domain-containing protein n=1 Tax=Mangrovicella endophytica TaxID=2066697 RepID=UPI001FE06A33|nr:DUF2283 domain-containing protein [Mangrovicella endophytica]